MDGEYYQHTTVNVFGLFILLLLGMLVMRAKKGQSLIPFLVLACVIAPAQRIVIAGMDFNFIRLMVLFGWARVFLRNEHTNFRLCIADKLMIAWAISGTALHTIQVGSSDGLVFMLGNSFEALGVYFLGRIFITSLEDVRALIKACCPLSILIMCFFVIEKETGRNMFSVFGGVPAFTDMREGRLRVQGAFAHPILAGSFWAAILPGVISLLFQKGKIRRIAALSLISILCIILLTASSTPVIGVLLAFLGMAFFPLRNKMRNVQLASLIGLLAISLVKKSPVWFLLGYIDVAGGSSGYYRALLIDQAVRHFKDWFLVGVTNTAYWNGNTGANLTDITCQYILQGLLGGFSTLVLFVAIIVVCFRSIGRLIGSQHFPKNDELLVWSLGVTLFTHAFMFLVVAYFGQIVMLWNLDLAIIVSIYVRYMPDAMPRRDMPMSLSPGVID